MDAMKDLGYNIDKRDRTTFVNAVKWSPCNNDPDCTLVENHLCLGDSSLIEVSASAEHQTMSVISEYGICLSPDIQFL